MLIISTQQFPIEVDPDVEASAIETESASLLVVTLRCARSVTSEAEVVLRESLDSWQVHTGGWLVDLDIDESLSWNESRTIAVLRAVWDFTTDRPDHVLSKFFDHIHGFAVSVPVKSVRIDSIESDPAEDLVG